MRGFLRSAMLAGAVVAMISAASAQDINASDPMREGAPEPTCRALAAPAVQEGPRRSRRGEGAASGPTQVLAIANDAARQRPDREGFVAARHVYTYAPGALYELYANPNFISTILLEPGEALNDVAAGDTSRWMVSETTAETQAEGQTVVLVKPQAAGLRTNIVLITDRRTYLVEAIAQAGEAYSAQIAWCYPQASVAGAASDQVEGLNFDYRVRAWRGRAPNWTPTRVFDDGRRTWIEFPAGVIASDMAPLFVITPEGAEIVNYRVQGQRYMVDRVFDIAELRLGARSPVIVRIERGSARSERPRRGGRP